MHVVLHAFVPHWYVPHPFGTSEHAPPPLHVETLVSTELTHVGAPHAVAGVANLHAVVVTPSHAAPQLVGVAVHALRDPCGAPFAGEHVPIAPLTSQAWHCPVQPLSQQTPSTQKPEPHSVEVVHATAFALEQRPRAVGSEQEKPVPVQAASQQTPPAQKPLVHAVAAEHASPLAAFGTHLRPVLQ